MPVLGRAAAEHRIRCIVVRAPADRVRLAEVRKAREILKKSAASQIKLSARCDALEAFATLIGMKAGLKNEKLKKLMNELYKEALSQRLVGVEDTLGSSIAAEIDDRPELPDQDDKS